MSEILDQIERIAQEFSPDPAGVPGPAEGEKWQRLRDALDGAFFNYWSLKRDSGYNDKKALHYFEAVTHYTNTIKRLVGLIYFYLEDYYVYNQQNHLQSRLEDRLTLDVEKLLSDTRSLLDAIHSLTCHLTPPEAKRGVKVSSYSKFAQRVTGVGQSSQQESQGEKLSYQVPLSFLADLASWGLTIRYLRDNYVHRGGDKGPATSQAITPLVLLHKDKAYFTPDWRREGFHPPKLHPALYANQEQALLDLEKFVVFIIAPVFALEQVLGHYITGLINRDFAEQVDLGQAYLRGNGQSYHGGPGVYAMFKLFSKHPDALRPDVYRNLVDGQTSPLLVEEESSET